MIHKRNTLLLLLTLCACLRLGAQQITLLRDIIPFDGDGVTKDFVAVADGKYFFYGSTAAAGRELWATDGTTAGTKLVKDIYPGSQSSCEDYPLVTFKGKAWFGATTDGFQYHLWSSDGTDAGTIQVVADSRLHLPRLMVAGTNYLYFVTTNSTNKVTLWQSDGTVVGTKKVTETVGTTSLQLLDQIAVVGDVCYMSLKAQLWKTDGTQAGTVLVKDISTGGNNFGDINELTAVGNKVYFAGDKNFNAWYTPWVSDGTTAGTFELAMPNQFGNSNPGWFFPFKNKVYFAAANSSSSFARTLWSTDGTKAGTAQFKDVIIAESGNGPADMAADANYLYFAGKTAADGSELWRTDGTLANTKMVKDLDPGMYSSSPVQLTFGNGKLYFQADWFDEGEELWVSDGTEAGSKVLGDLQPLTSDGSRPRSIRQVGNTLIFIADDNLYGTELFTLDITSGTRSPRPEIEFTVSPNPATGPLRVTLPEAANWQEGRFRLLNAAGAAIWEGLPVGTVTDLSLPALAPGLYWMEYAEQGGKFGRTAVTLLR